MAEKLKTDICIIGAGSGGLSVAASAAQLGASVVLVERNVMGGECLNTGCIPSKAMIATARTANTIKQSKAFGIDVSKSSVHFDRVNQYVQDVIDNIAPHDSIERFEKMGVKVIQGTAKFINKNEVNVNNISIKARWFVIATGSSPAIPPIPGIKETPYFTNETIFNLKKQPKHLLIIGGGAISCELAQAFQRLGTQVSIIQRSTILKKEDPALTQIIRQELINDGVKFYEQLNIVSIQNDKKSVIINLNKDGNEISLKGSHLLIATGRKPNIDALDLEKAHIQFSKKSINIDKRLRTSNKKVFALGDVIGGYQFTHIASYQAGIVIKNALFHWPAKVNYAIVPWAIYTEPEFAHVGLRESEARTKYKNIKIFTSEFLNNDRAQTEKDTIGLIKVIAKKNGHILGVSIIGHEAGDLITPWVLAIKKRMKIGEFADLMIPYPTRSEIHQSVARNFYKPFIFSNKIKKIVRFLMKWF